MLRGVEADNSILAPCQTNLSPVPNVNRPTATS